MKSSQNGKFEAEFLEWVWKETESRKGREGGVEGKSRKALRCIIMKRTRTLKTKF